MKKILPLLLVAFLMAGCSSYYRVVDTGTNRVYYTKSISNRKSGAITFTDASTQEKVTILQCTQKKISKEEFENNVSKPGEEKSGW